ncbi:hypothetical protein niasHT_024308 [Heterodera trifolii]|uniref:Uncharacterized protein n=1 Tax=Heterodera trifolii TaxID=157864 RepID=A0ABD2JM94_9BILA
MVGAQKFADLNVQKTANGFLSWMICFHAPASVDRRRLPEAGFSPPPPPMVRRRHFARGGTANAAAMFRNGTSISRMVFPREIEARNASPHQSTRRKRRAEKCEFGGSSPPLVRVLWWNKAKDVKNSFLMT